MIKFVTKPNINYFGTGANISLLRLTSGNNLITQYSCNDLLTDHVVRIQQWWGYFLHCLRFRLKTIEYNPLIPDPMALLVACGITHGSEL